MLAQLRVGAEPPDCQRMPVGTINSKHVNFRPARGGKNDLAYTQQRRSLGYPKNFGHPRFGGNGINLFIGLF
jgi:hypothetical protein